jgi:hypothetical protein
MPRTDDLIDWLNRHDKARKPLPEVNLVHDLCSECKAPVAA